ncbi:hypothetical protein G6O69_36015 [Pseudenhygromyxa sp. WMMC2535]|uniref:hypothetical protein n=1 Tax=Pseudenhygromyxa sp. WMMC2535 TaxID=2712867 RepID=UPI0015519150|nr:hypothetical protein [Pseudenhygromyxa sp. WMMC2535]NVB43287.1 hypothetical protein [Pseudenhygromyxa sp. WMMC2535]
MTENNQTIALELELEQINLILQTLGEQPFSQVYQLINSIQTQAQAQLSAERSASAQPSQPTVVAEQEAG